MRPFAAAALLFGFALTMAAATKASARHGSERHREPIRSISIDAVAVSDRAISPNNDDVQDTATLTVTGTAVLPHMEDASEHTYADWVFVRMDGGNGESDLLDGIVELADEWTDVETHGHVETHGRASLHHGHGHDGDDDHPDFARTVSWSTVWNPVFLNDGTYAVQAGQRPVRAGTAGGSGDLQSLGVLESTSGSDRRRPGRQRVV